MSSTHSHPSSLKSNPVGTYNAPGVGEQAASTTESLTGSSPSSAAVNGRTLGVSSHLGKITLNETDAGSTIAIENAKATINISESGHLDIISSSGSGVTITATAGKVVMNAVDVVIKSSGAMSIDSGSDLNFNAKGGINFTTPTGAINMTGQSMSQTINGTYSMHITKELNMIVGGHMRNTVGGDYRSQISGFSYQDVGGEMKLRSTGELILNSSDSLNMYASADSGFYTKAKMTISADGDTSVNTKGTMQIASTGDATYSSEASTTLTSGSNLSTSAGGSCGIYAGGGIGIDGATIDMQNGQAEEKETVAPATAQAPEKAQTVESEAIQDELSTVRKSPSYPYNAKGRTNSGTGRMRNKGSSSGQGAGENPNATKNGVDERLVNITDCAKQQYEAQTGHRVGLVSGYRPGDPRFHGKGKAMDFAIYDQNGKMFGNYQNSVSSEGFRAYEAFAQQAKSCQEQLYPGLPIRWGGYFWNGGKGNYGAMDPMHLDIGGTSTAGGNWNQGASPQQLREWGLSSNATRPYNGKPNYSGLSKNTNPANAVKGNETGMENGGATGDQWKKLQGTEADKETKANKTAGDKKVE